MNVFSSRTDTYLTSNNFLFARAKALPITRPERTMNKTL